MSPVFSLPSLSVSFARSTAESSGIASAEEFDVDVSKWEQAGAIVAGWEALPLIVLAGLR